MADYQCWDEPECPPPGFQRSDSEDMWTEAVVDTSSGCYRDKVTETGSLFKSPDLDTKGSSYDLIDMEDPNIPLSMLTDWVLNAPLEGPIGNEPLILNPGMNVSAELAELIAARCTNALPARGVLRAGRAQDPGRTRQRVRWREPVVVSEQDPPGYKLTPEAHDAPTVAWVGCGESGSSTARAEMLPSHSSDWQGAPASDSRAARYSWWKGESSEAASKREAWSSSWASGSNVSWDSQSGSTTWPSSWTTGWDAPNVTSGSQWWQGSQSSWNATSSWSDDKWGSWRGSEPAESSKRQTAASSAKFIPTVRARCDETGGDAEASSQATAQHWSGQSGVPPRKLNREADHTAYAGLGSAPKPRGNRSPDRRGTFEMQRVAADSSGWGKDQRLGGREQPMSAGWWEGTWGRRATPVARGSIPRPKEGWLHTDGIALAELEEGLEVHGTVTNITKPGAFINFGAHKDGLLGSQSLKALGRNVEVGDLITELQIGHIDLEKNRITLRLAAKAPQRSMPFSGECTSSDESDRDHWNKSFGAKKSRGPAGGSRGEPTTCDSQKGQEVPVGWKGMHSMWTEGGTGGTRGARD